MQSGYATPAVLSLAALLCAACSGATKHQEEGGATSGGQAAASRPAPQPGEAALLAAAQQARQSFADGAPSVDALMDALVQALSRKDMNALDQLRVSKAEYVDLIVPGTVPLGQPPRQVSAEPKEFFWSMLDTRSRYFADNLVAQLGGRTYRSHQLRFSKPPKEFAWYTAHGEVRMDLEGEDDVTYHLLAGWVAEVDGKYKFIGYEYND